MNKTKKCKECQTDIPLKAKRCLNCKSDLRNWVQRHPIGTILLIFILIPIVVAVSTSGDSIDTDANSTYAENQTDNFNPVKKEYVSNWDYRTETDEFSGNKKFYAVNRSKTLLYFDFPYNGGSTFDLIIRGDKKGNGDEVIIRTSQGQFLDYDEKINVKFDNGASLSYGISGAADGSSNLIFIKNSKDFIDKLIASKEVKIEAPFYQEGRRVINFETYNYRGINPTPVISLSIGSVYLLNKNVQEFLGDGKVLLKKSIEDDTVVYKLEINQEVRLLEQEPLKEKSFWIRDLENFGNNYCYVEVGQEKGWLDCGWLVDSE